MKTCSKCEKPMMMQTVKEGKDLRNLGYRLEAYEAWLNGSQRSLKEWFL